MTSNLWLGTLSLVSKTKLPVYPVSPLKMMYHSYYLTKNSIQCILKFSFDSIDVIAIAIARYYFLYNIWKLIFFIFTKSVMNHQLTLKEPRLTFIFISSNFVNWTSFTLKSNRVSADLLSRLAWMYNRKLLLRNVTWLKLSIRSE